MKRYPLNSLFRISHYDCGAKKDISIMYIKSRSSLVPRPVHAIRVTRRGLKPSASPRRIFSSSLTGDVTLISSRTAGNEAGAEVVSSLICCFSQRDIYLMQLVSVEGKLVPVSLKSAF